VAEVETWVDGAYAMAQAAGDRLPATDKAKVAAELAEYTGVSELFVGQSNLKHRRFPGNCSTPGIRAARLREPSWHWPDAGGKSSWPLAKNNYVVTAAPLNQIAPGLPACCVWV
jgi:hypothetical protein